jgi:hypothetical protein
VKKKQAEPRRIETPAPARVSNLDGLALIAVDTDPDETVSSVLLMATLARHDVVGVLPFLFHGDRRGYLVVTYDPTKDPRAHGRS